MRPAGMQETREGDNLRAELLEPACIGEGQRHEIDGREDSEFAFQAFPFSKGTACVAEDKGRV